MDLYSTWQGVPMTAVYFCILSVQNGAPFLVQTRQFIAC
jgi:hypothetical protein